MFTNKMIIQYCSYSDTIRDAATNYCLLSRDGREWSTRMLDSAVPLEQAIPIFSAIHAIHSVQYCDDGARVASFLNVFANGGGFGFTGALIAHSDKRKVCTDAHKAIRLDLVTRKASVTLTAIRDVLIGLGFDVIDLVNISYAVDITNGKVGMLRVWVEHELIGYLELAEVTP